jgi:hypothetical protein
VVERAEGAGRKAGDAGEQSQTKPNGLSAVQPARCARNLENEANLANFFAMSDFEKFGKTKLKGAP